MAFLYAMMIFVFAGTMNGSFALPSKHLQNWSFQRIWLNYSIWAFLIFPCALLTLLAPKAWQIYWHIPMPMLMIILIGGFLFAIGQICFSRALQSIGLSLGFVINISIGTALGSLIPLVLLHPEKVATTQGITTVIGVTTIIIGVLFSYVAGLKRDKGKVNQVSQKSYFLGVFFAMLAGLFSAGQNITFSLTNSLQQQAIDAGLGQLASANIIWPVFLIATFIPYSLYMVYLRCKNNQSEKNYNSVNYYIATLIMGAFWYFSLILYSAASLNIGDLGPVIGWPLFMVCIILTANMWGWRHGEWADASVQAKKLAKLSILILIAAILILAFAAFLSLH